jgi:uridine kinase
VEEDYSFLEGKYQFDTESFWYEVESNIESYSDYENPTFEDFIEDYDFVTDEDKEEIKRIYDEVFENK